MKGGRELEGSTDKTFGYRNRIEQELALREHDLKLKTLDNSIKIQSRQIENVETEVIELKLIVNEMKSSNKILIYIASVITTAIVTQMMAQLFN